MPNYEYWLVWDDAVFRADTYRECVDYYKTRYKQPFPMWIYKVKKISEIHKCRDTGKYYIERCDNGKKH